ncbi:serine/threonine kinase family protein [Plesiocystis pacifica SIR-1]|uniref:Serine/threonine kinase family protein n=1 Tax=Plesiocystis pacifica SIR-1 TaxID=391625 RepID=A6G9I0_9BACT|nr:serine/threonine-protein kinase [Plesiocystis pacifica]EDM77488.1 serine/threonine kinase family protein [Plesiocystis pacifica SIR-1]
MSGEDLERTLLLEEHERAQRGIPDYVPPSHDAFQLGRYRLLECIGEGGMGSIFLAEDPELDRHLAVKVLHTPGRGNAPTRLLREAQAMARLSHPNVVAIYDVGRIGSETFIAMEYLGGGTLQTWLEARDRSWGEVLAMYMRAGQGLAAAHAAGLIHRDFKPANVLLTLEGVPKVTDFGLVRVTEAARELHDAAAPELYRELERSPSEKVSSSRIGKALALRLTRDGATLGTPGYMAPEQFRGQVADARSDQFSFCVALYEALCGATPFGGDSTRSRAKAVLSNDRLPWPRDPARPIPDWIEPILDRGLAFEPERRWPSMTALLDALTGDRSRRRKQRRRRAIGVGASVALCVGIGLGLGVQRRAQRRACSRDAHTVAGLWRDGQADLFAALEAGGPRYAEAHSARVMAATANWVERWARVREQHCLERAGLGVSVEALPATAQSRCLDSDREAFAALLEVFGEAGQREGVAAHALEAVEALPPPEDCAALDGEVLVEEACAPGLYRSLHRLRMLQLAGLFHQGARFGANLLADPELRACPELHDDVRVIAAQLDHALDRLDEADAGFRAALHSAGVRDDLPTTLDATLGLARVAEAREQPELALFMLELTAVLVERLGSPPERQVELHIHRARCQFRLADPQAADEELRAARALLDEFLGEQHPLRIEWSLLSSDLHHLRGDFDAAIADSKSALSLANALYGPDHPTALRALNAMSSALDDIDGEAALAVQRRAVTMVEHLYPLEHPRNLESKLALGTALATSGRAREGLEVLAQLIATLEAMDDPDSLLLSRALINRAYLLRSEFRYAEARRALLRAVEVSEDPAGPSRFSLGYSLALLGDVQGRTTSLDEGAATLARAAVLLRALDPQHPTLASLGGDAGALELRRGHPRAAADHYRESLAIERASKGEHSPRLAHYLIGLGRAYAALGQRDEALAQLERARELSGRELDERTARLARTNGLGRSIEAALHARALIELAASLLEGGAGERGDAARAAERGRALELSTEAYAMRESVRDPVRRAELVFVHARVLAAHGQRESAQRVAGEAAQTLEHAPSSWIDVEPLQTLIRDSQLLPSRSR